MDGEDPLLPSAAAQPLDSLGRPAPRQPWPPRLEVYHRRLEILVLHLRSGDRGEVRVLRDLLQLHHLSDGSPGRVHCFRRRQAQLVVRRRLDAPPPRCSRRRFVPREGLSILTLSAALPTPGLETLLSQRGLFFSAIYILAFAQGGHKPCAQAFAADQFDENDPEESRSKSSFFNWWYFAMCAGATSAFLVLSYIQDNISWGLGFGIPGIAMVIALLVFLLGTRTYRYYTTAAQIPLKPSRSKTSGSSLIPFLSKEGAETVAQLKGVLFKLFPVWATSSMYAVVFAQTTTLFTKQSSTVDGRIGQLFRVPPAALLTFISFTIVIFIPIYDRVFVPMARKMTGLHSGITMLQRIGVGLFLAIIAMVIAALVEMKRLKTARVFGLLDTPDAMIPMSLSWFFPQYVIFGIADVFTIIGWQEFFYDQVPNNLRSIGSSMYLSILGVGSFISSLLVMVIDQISKGSGEGWFADNLNRAHIDYFYWLLAGLNFLGLILFLYFARSYQYKSKDIMVV